MDELLKFYAFCRDCCTGFGPSRNKDVVDMQMQIHNDEHHGGAS